MLNEGISEWYIRKEIKLKMKKLFVFLIIALCFCNRNKAISQVVVSGTTGDCTWEITGTSGNYTLTISGSGAMADYPSDSTPPWYYRKDINTLFIEEGVAAIGKFAFYNCSGLTSVTIPNSVTTIGKSAFSFCSSLTSVTIGNSIATIGEYTFFYCQSLTSVTIPKSVTAIGEAAFYGCRSLASVAIPNSVTAIGESAFSFCSSLTSVAIPNSVTAIGKCAFCYCNGLTEVYAKTINLHGNSVTSIGDSAFEDCNRGLTSITIGNSVTIIGDRAFGYCFGLTEVHVKAIDPPLLESKVFHVPKAIPVHVPCGRETAYQNAQEWNYFTNIIGDIPFDITLQSNDDAKGSVNIIQANTCANNTAIVEAIANAGYHFVQWNDGNTDNPRTIKVTQNITFMARFEKGNAE
jgi:hypothetical protein